MIIHTSPNISLSPSMSHCSLLSCPCPCIQPQAWTNRKHLVLSENSLCVLMSVRVKTEGVQTLPSTPWSHCKHTYRSTRNIKGTENLRERQTGRSRWREQGQLRKQHWEPEKVSSTYLTSWHNKHIDIILWWFIISASGILWFIVAANQCGLLQHKQILLIIIMRLCAVCWYNWFEREVFVQYLSRTLLHYVHH